MDLLPQIRNGRGRGAGSTFDGIEGGKRQARNKQWIAEHLGARSTNVAPTNDNERWERGGQRGGRARGAVRGGRRFPNATLIRTQPPAHSEDEQEIVEDGFATDDPDPGTPEEREKFYQELVKAREVERRKAIAEGKMDDPLIPKRLEDAINLVGTCMDMCPRFERYRRERENNLFEWEAIPGTKRVDHKRAVKMYERAAGDKTLPSDLRPPVVLKRTLDYLFHDLLPRGGFSQSFNFIRDRSRAVRNDFTMQHETGPLAMECHDRCARFHILALHFERDRPGFSIALEEQQLMNTLQSLKEFYEDQRKRFQSPNELEMRVYHRLIHIRDQKERHEDVPAHVTDHPVFKLTTKFRLHVQNKSAPIGKATPLVVDNEGMQIFGELAFVLRQQGSVVMIYLVACLLERLFGKDAIEDIETIRGDLTIPELIDGVPLIEPPSENHTPERHYSEIQDTDEGIVQTASPIPLKPSATEWLSSNFGPNPTASAIFGQNLASSAFGTTEEQTAPVSAFSSLSSSPNPFGPNATFGGPVVTTSPKPKSVFTITADAPGTQFPSWSTSSSTVNALPSTSSRPEISPFTGPPEASPLLVSSTGQASIPAFSSSITNASRPQQAATRTSGSPLSHQLFPDSTHSISDPNAQAFSPAITRQTTLSFSASESKTFASANSQLPQSNTHDFTQAPTTSTLRFPPASPITDANTVAIAGSLQTSGLDTSSTSESNQASFLSSSHTSTFPHSHQLNNSPSLNMVAPPHESSTPSPPPPSHYPPSVNKKRFVSLPTTPTSPLKLALSKSLLDSVRNQTLVSSSPELLSPLYLPSPSTSPVRNFNGNMTPSNSTPDTSANPISVPSQVLESPNGKAKRHAPDLDGLAIAFAKKSLLVKNCFNHWLEKTTDRAAWLDACEHSDNHRSKIQRRRMSPIIISERKRTSSTLFQQSPQKRIRTRISGEYKPPLTDEELAQRFKENQEEHARRWAKESFLRITRRHVEMEHGSYPPNWMVWLSMNPENDGTAIWLECKFNVPTSGQWESENVFSIPLSDSDSQLPSSPGLIVFECTPLEGVMDELGRKFRVLDDCARLRDLIKVLPPKRHFVPSLLVLSWIEIKPPDMESDLLIMITNFVKSSVLGGYHILNIASATTNLDEKYDMALRSLPLDTEGKLVQMMTIPGLFQHFLGLLTSFVSEWVGKCSINGEFDWAFYAQILEISVKLLNEMAHEILNLVNAGADFDPLPYSDAIHDIVDMESCYTVTMSWLESDKYFGSEAASISKDLLSHFNMGHDFPAMTFLEHLCHLARFQVESHGGTDGKTQFTISNAEIAESAQRFQGLLESYTVELVKMYALHVRRSPKRRFASEETTTTTTSAASKRRKLSISGDTSVRDERSPTPEILANGDRVSSPSASTTSTMPSEIITVSMLRALTKDMRKKYVL